MISSDLVDSILQAFEKVSAKHLKVENANSKIEFMKKEDDYTPPIVYGSSVSIFSGPGAKKFPAVSDWGAAPEKKKKHFYDVKSLHVGFVHRRDSGGDRNIIKLRELVKKGQVLAYIRSMNIMHDVVSDIDGKVIEVLVEEGQAVEYGQPIFRLKPIKD